VPLPPEIVRGVALFDAGDYFEAHEAWEDHWGKGPPEERALTLGLIKAAVALHHLAAGNAVGFAWQAEKAVPLLRANAGVWRELDAAALADAIESLAAQQRLHGAIGEGWERPRLGRFEAT
jgi:predicted metal-dependent hydrolase